MSRIPLKQVMFNQMTSVPGTNIMMMTVTPMACRLAGGESYTCPQPYLDEVADCIVIEDREYPMSRVHYYVRAKAAKSVPESMDVESFTVGKREPRRIKISVEERTDLGPAKRGPKD